MDDEQHKRLRQALMFRVIVTTVEYVLIAILIAAAIMIIFGKDARAADNCLAYRSMVAREAQAVNGPDAPTPMFLSQLKQESSCRPGITAGDGGMGISQFMAGTVKQVAGLFPELGPADPYNPKWSVRAMVRYDGWIYRRVKGKDQCHRWAAVLKGYNAGAGYVQQAQKASPDPLTWFGVTEFIPTRQSAANFEYSRTYPRKVLLQHQKVYVSTGKTICLPEPT